MRIFISNFYFTNTLISTSDNFFHILMHSTSISYNGTIHLLGRRRKAGEVKRTGELGEREMGVLDYFYCFHQPSPHPLISPLLLICKSIDGTVGPAALSHSTPVICGLCSPYSPSLIDLMQGFLTISTKKIHALYSQYIIHRFYALK